MWWWLTATRDVVVVDAAMAVTKTTEEKRREGVWRGREDVGSGVCLDGQRGRTGKSVACEDCHGEEQVEAQQSWEKVYLHEMKRGNAHFFCVD
ncbi:hypothetical protein Droror1_Dr00023173 [Drosera rotundifolia]